MVRCVAMLLVQEMVFKLSKLELRFFVPVCYFKRLIHTCFLSRCNSQYHYINQIRIQMNLIMAKNNLASFCINIAINWAIARQRFIKWAP